MALALSVVGGAIGAGLGVGALSGMWGIPAVVAVATVGVVTVGVVGGGAGGGRGSVAACSAPADSACAPAAAGVPVVIPVVNDWPNDCGDNGAVAAAAAGGMPAAGTDGPPTPTAGAPAAVRPRAAASAATTRSVTISWVSQRRSWRPSLVPLAGSAAARGPSRSRASAASTSSTATATPATVATTRSATMRAASRREEEPGNRLRPLMSRSPSPPANRPTDPRNRPEPGPTTARAPARPAGSHRKPAWPCPGRVARRRARAGRSTPRCPRG